jgi:uncharacterized protein (DUF488 family)
MLTIGHSNRPLAEFLEMLQAHQVELLVDVRTMPRSRYNPQFNRDALPHSLAAVGIAYEHMPELGGLRHARPDSANTGWRNLSFRGYADYMQTAAYAGALQVLQERDAERTVAIMCAESVPWRCHRSLIADALVARGVAVGHIMSATQVNPHRLTSFALVEGTRVTYPASALALFDGPIPLS